MKKFLLITAGVSSLSLGVVGVFLPLLPTTPFLLLSAACFLRSSRSLYLWITGHRVFGRYISAYLRFRAVSLRAKVSALVLLWVSILSTTIFFVSVVWLDLLLITIATAVSFHILRLRTLTAEMRRDLDRDFRHEG